MDVRREAKTGRVHSVLLIDDDPTEAELLRSARDSAGIACDIHYAESGSEGLAQCGALSPDLVLVDLNMPGKSGFEVIAEITALPSRPPQIAAFSTSRSEDDRKRALEAGACLYRSKPRTLEEYVAFIKETCGGADR
ncbi:MAG: response regulator [Oceanicaulis sp.]